MPGTGSATGALPIGTNIRAKVDRAQFETDATAHDRSSERRPADTDDGNLPTLP
jgi:hypothetical protein